MVMTYSSHEYVSSVLDEIALEGLDGITLQGLWLRLSQRPGLCFDSDDFTKIYIWNLIKRLKDVEMFELVDPRSDVVIFDRFHFVDPELGTVIEPNECPEDIYPYHPVEDTICGNRGSCASYNDRTNITNIVKTLTLEEAMSRWGSKLVIVANQRTRTNALQGDNIDPVMELTLVRYCLLERIGRSRYHGEVTIGKVSLQQLGIDSKSLFYLRKYLINHKLITKQIYHVKSGAQNSSGSLLHLARFYVLRRPKVLILTKKVVEILKSRRGNFAEYEEIRQVLGLYYSLKKLLKTTEFQRLIKTDMKLPYRTVYPEAKPSEWKLKANDKEKMVRVIQLINPDVDLEELWSKDEEDEEDNYNGYLGQGKVFIDRPLLHQACDVFDEAGPKGLSQIELGMIMGQTRLESRNICRNLVKCGAVSMYMQDVGRQRVTRFMSRKYSNQGEMSVQYEKERKKMIELLSTKPETDSPPSIAEIQDLSMANEDDEKINSVLSAEPSAQVNEIGENVVTEVVEDAVKPCRNTVYSGFQENLLSTRWNQKKDSPSMSYRLLKRTNLIMECVKMHKVIYDCKKLMQLINDEEEKEGYHVKIDKKSLFRLLGKLKKDGLIKHISITLRMKNNVKDLKFICEPSVTKDDAVIQSAVEQAKVKFFIHHKDPSKLSHSECKNVTASENNDSTETVLIKKEKKDPLGISNDEKLSVFRKSLGNKYGFSPKFVRMKLLHRFLFYLIYGYEGEEGLDQSKQVEQIILNGDNLNAELIKELPTIYFPKIGWKAFVPPLPKHSGYPEGWTFMSDWLLRIPLSLFVKIYNITYTIPSLEEYLNHPIRQYYLVKSLPSKLRKYLFMGRRYIFSIHEIVCRLCYIGLIQFGPQRLKEKDQVFIFLNRKATLLDTTPSLPGYHQVSPDINYESHCYYFNQLSDVEKYWYDMWNICIKTHLGGRMCVTGNNITLESLATKEAMIEATQPRNADEAPRLDTGFIPGDLRGAAGLDSAIFSHLKRNWNWNTLAKKGGFSSKVENQNPKEISLRTAKLAKIKQGKEKLNIVQQIMCSTSNNVKPRKVNERLGKVSGMPRKRSVSTSVQNLCKKKVEKAKHVVRKVLPRKTRRPRPYYDEEDRKALAKMKKLRVDWSETEDALLLTCKVAGLYFFPNPRYLTISMQAVRDVLHQTFKESKNKTSRACQRRIHYIMRNPATAHNVALSLLDLKHDPFIKDKFEEIIQKANTTAKTKEHLEKLLRPAFTELVDILSKRMDSMSRSSTSHDVAQGTIENLRSKYAIAFPHTLETKSRFYDVNSVDDIYKGVLHSVIHSSFCCTADKTSWVYQLFKVYQQYSDSFLKAAMNKFRTDQMVTLKKQYSKSYYKSGNFLPISSCPYQLSVNYAYLFQTEYKFDIFQQAFKILKKLEQEIHMNQGKDKIEVTNVDGGGAAALIELFSTNKVSLSAVIPEQVIVLDPVITQRKEGYDRLLKRFHDIENTYHDEIGVEIPTNPLVGSGKRKRSPESAKEDAGTKIIKLDGGKSESVENEEFKKSSNAEDETLSGSRFLSNNAACTASRIALFLMRKEMTDSSVIDPHHAHDFFVVNSSEVFCEVNDVSIIQSTEAQAKLVETVLRNIKSTLLLSDDYSSFDYLYQKYMEAGAGNANWKLACEIMNYVGHAKEMGATIAELRENFGNRQDLLSLSWHLNMMAKESVFVRVGITTLRYVHYEYIKPWIVHSNKLLRLQRENIKPTEIKGVTLNEGLEPSSQPKAVVQEKEESSSDEVVSGAAEKSNEEQVSPACVMKKPRERWPKSTLGVEENLGGFNWNSTAKIKVIIRPWVRVDGSLNRRVLDRFLGSVLSHILQHPGSCIKDLGHRFTPALQPCHTRELIEILSCLGCVKLGALKMKKPTLFSKPSKVTLVEPDGTEDESSIFISPQLDAVSKLGIFVGDKKYVADFLGKIL